jgi:hypothetical protein
MSIATLRPMLRLLTSSLSSKGSKELSQVTADSATTNGIINGEKERAKPNHTFDTEGTVDEDV